MIYHYFLFQDGIVPQIDTQFDTLFSNTDKQVKEYISENGMFDKTPIFQNLDKTIHKTTLSTSGSGVLRMISHALSTETHKSSISFIGESTISDGQFSDFTNNSQKNTLFINTLAEQIHLTPGVHQSPLNIRLGALRKNILSARPFLADSTFLFFNINALKWSDSPAQAGNNPSGLTSEEANQLAYLAGQSHKNKFLILYGFENFDRDPYGLSINSAMQILWYYQLGMIEKSQEWPIPHDQYQEFTIESKAFPTNLVFRKDKKSGHWFHKLPFELPSDLSEHQWIATTYEEYLATANEDIPHRIMEWYDIVS